jgi:hypothetical protein
MANLITEKQKKIIKTEYYVRLLSVSLFVPVALLGIFLLAYVIPYYISVSNKDIKVAEQFKAVIGVENNENTGESMSQIVIQTLDQMKAVELYGKAGIIPSDYFNKIIINKNSNIKINNLSFVSTGNNQGQIVVAGASKSREGLVAYIEDLKALAQFTDIDSPISDFAKDTDISFTLNIKIAI